jgi:outer membrane protein assembly factor BamE (lipoprotein component of BamABCDE complex)
MLELSKKEGLIMKRLFKLLSISLCFMFLAPAFAISETDRYQAKIEKARLKRELKCAKNPEKCISEPIQSQQMTLGAVQKNVKVGCSQDQVLAALGSPNIITKDSDGKDTWVYDKLSSVSSYDNSGFAVGIILAGYGKNSGKVQTQQKTLTVIIKFDKKNLVESFSYHMSNF